MQTSAPAQSYFLAMARDRQTMAWWQNWPIIRKTATSIDFRTRGAA